MKGNKMKENLSNERLELLVNFFEDLDNLYYETQARDIDESRRMRQLLDDIYDSATSLLSVSDHYKLNQRLA